jgi:hypothetical protein
MLCDSLSQCDCCLCTLQARGWAIELCAGVDEDGYSANSAAYLFTVSIVLTEAGLAAGPGFGLAPVTLLFQYLHMIQCTGKSKSNTTGCSTQPSPSSTEESRRDTDLGADGLRGCVDSS